MAVQTTLQIASQTYTHKMKKQFTDVYQIVTDKIIALLQGGTIPWRKPWTVDNSGRPQMPVNLVSKRPYRGINVWMLAAAGYASPYWLTYNQCAKLGGQVRAGEQSTLAVFWKRDEIEDKKTGETKRVFLLRYYRVFNVEQCDGLEAKLPKVEKPKKSAKKFNPVAEAEKIVAGMPKRPEIIYNGSAACYSPMFDRVKMPVKESFDSPSGFYTTLFHELAHSTGHASREGRFAGCAEDAKQFGSEPYAKEELIAEMTAAFLCAISGIENTADHSAAYIKGWLKALKNDHKMVVHAAAAAHRAADYVLDVNHDEAAE
jgi:antirestriction protein ArdC